MDHTPDEFIGPVNLGNPVETPVRHLAEKILQLVNGKSKLIFHPLPVDDPMQRCPDISLAREKLHWEPKVDLDTGLTRTIEFFDALLKSNKSVRGIGR
jgi:UDP-glucuronate decarboxylase